MQSADNNVVQYSRISPPPTLRAARFICAIISAQTLWCVLLSATILSFLLAGLGRVVSTPLTEATLTLSRGKEAMLFHRGPLRTTELRPGTPIEIIGGNQSLIIFGAIGTRRIVRADIENDNAWVVDPEVTRGFIEERDLFGWPFKYLVRGVRFKSGTRVPFAKGDLSTLIGIRIVAPSNRNFRQAAALGNATLGLLPLPVRVVPAVGSIACLATLLLSIWLILRALIRVLRIRGAKCPYCAYPSAHREMTRCPECGREHEEAHVRTLLMK